MIYLERHELNLCIIMTFPSHTEKKKRMLYNPSPLRKINILKEHRGDDEKKLCHNIMVLLKIKKTEPQLSMVIGLTKLFSIIIYYKYITHGL